MRDTNYEQKYPNITTTILLGVLTVVVSVALVWLVYHTLSLPTVYESYTLGNCVRVDDTQGVYTCENLPQKYHHQLVQ